VSHLTHAAIALDALLAEVSGPECGGTCVFLGTVRNEPGQSGEPGVTAIEYSAYETMVEAEFARLLDDARARWPAARLAVRHRLGTIPAGEASIAIVAAGPARRPPGVGCAAHGRQRHLGGPLRPPHRQAFACLTLCRTPCGARSRACASP
jgi:molybdopterin synthase catalytic subunit